ncbi:MAG TPA: hypothetical protein VHR45_25230 [Thermoanaerobaculia bacterium]|nr:hypothetical protein [Thermoanaerobaculia bacterium]
MSAAPHLVVCIASEGAEDLEVLKVYRRLPDEVAEGMGFFRVIDDSGEDYLYPQADFLPLPLPPALEQQLEGLAVERSLA